MKIVAFALALAATACHHGNTASTSGTTGGGSNGSAAATCPPPKQTDEACAAVMTYAKSGETCCAYPTPCAVPIAGPQYSDASCTSPTGK